MRPTLNDFMQLIQQQALRDPQVKAAMDMIQGKTQQELRSMAMNMCKERKTTPEQVLQSLGIW